MESAIRFVDTAPAPFGVLVLEPDKVSLGPSGFRTEPYLYPVTIVQARYAGSYEGGAWLAFPCHPGHLGRMCPAWNDSDIECWQFWRYVAAEGWPIGRGEDPNLARTDLLARLAAFPYTATPHGGVPPARGRRPLHWLPRTDRQRWKTAPIAWPRWGLVLYVAASGGVSLAAGVPFGVLHGRSVGLWATSAVSVLFGFFACDVPALWRYVYRTCQQRRRGER